MRFVERLTFHSGPCGWSLNSCLCGAPLAEALRGAYSTLRHTSDATVQVQIAPRAWIAAPSVWCFLGARRSSLHNSSNPSLAALVRLAGSPVGRRAPAGYAVRMMGGIVIHRRVCCGLGRRHLGRFLPGPIRTRLRDAAASR